MTVPGRPKRSLPGASETPSPRPADLAIERRARPQEVGGTRSGYVSAEARAAMSSA